MISIELVSVFQPIMDVAGGIRPLGYEALIRGRGLFRLRGAKDVFEAPKSHQNLKELDHHIRDLQISVGPKILSGEEKLFLNMPPQAFGDDSWRILQTVAQHLVIEISEHAYVSEKDVAWLSVFREFGAQFAIDDYGNGATSIKTLALLNPEYLKLDMFFVKNRDYETIRKLRRFAEDWHAKVIVEGVETAAEAVAVMDAGVRYIQGFFYGKPKEAIFWSQRRSTAEEEGCQT